MLSALLLFGVAVVLRLVLAGERGLWADELFSLAMATGHSLEHPAAEADPARGDFVEQREARRQPRTLGTSSMRARRPAPAASSAPSSSPTPARHSTTCC